MFNPRSGWSAQVRGLAGVSRAPAISANRSDRLNISFDSQKRRYPRNPRRGYAVNRENSSKSLQSSQSLPFENPMTSIGILAEL